MDEARSAWRPMVQPDLKTQIVDGEAVLLDRANERVHQLDGVGTFILECCDGTMTQDDIVAKVVNWYEVANETAAADAADLLARMKTLGILV